MQKFRHDAQPNNCPLVLINHCPIFLKKHVMIKNLFARIKVFGPLPLHTTFAKIMLVLIKHQQKLMEMASLLSYAISGSRLIIQLFNNISLL